MAAPRGSLLNHALGRLPTLIDALLVTGRIRADGRYLCHGAREVDAQMPVKVVVRAVLRAMGHGVRGRHVHTAIRKDDPHRLGIPGVTAKGLVQVCGILRRQRLGVRMGAQGEHMHLPA